MAVAGNANLKAFKPPGGGNQTTNTANTAANNNAAAAAAAAAGGIMMNNGSQHNQHVYGSLQNFEMEKQIGQGQFSQVFKARCLVDNRVVALKRMKVVLNPRQCFS
jgi:serine/threonine protein kinase